MIANLDRAHTYVRRECVGCGSSFTARSWEVKRGRGKYCSLTCRGEYKQPTPKKESVPTVQLGTLSIGEKFLIDNRQGRVVDKMLVFDAVRIRIGRRTDLWHRRICVQRVP